MADESSPSNVHNKPKNQWTTLQREVLCVLVKFYQNALSESVKVFNALFEEELRECNFTDGIPHRSLTTQWYELYTSGSAVFERVQIETLLSDESGRWVDLRNEIEETAERVGVSLIKRKFEHLRDTSKFGSRSQKLHGYAGEDRDDRDDDKLPDEAADTEENPLALPISELNSSSPFTPRRTKKLQQRVTNNTSSRLRAYTGTPQQRPQQHERPPGSNRFSPPNMTTPASGRRRTGSIQVQAPPLLYRYWGTNSNGFNSTTQFVAGLFCNNPQSVYSIASYTPDEIDTMTSNHLMRMEIPSPYISTSATLFSPLHRALQQEVPAAVSIIDVSKLDSTTTALFSAQKIISEGHLEFPRDYTYKGLNEWLIWREIPASAIICTFTVDSLIEIANDFPEIESTLLLSALQRCKQAGHAKSFLRNSSAKVDEPTGRIIGMFLRLISVPDRYVEKVSETILTAWSIEGLTWDGRGRGRGENYKERHENYLRGVRGGYGFLIEQERRPGLPLPEMEDEIDEGEVASVSIGQDVLSSPSLVMTPDSSPLGKLQLKEEELDQRNKINSSIDQEEIWSSSPIPTPNTSPLGGGVSGAPAGLRISVPAGQSRQPQSTLPGVKHELKKDEIGKDTPIDPIEWEIIDMQETMEWEAMNAESHSSAREDDYDYEEVQKDVIYDQGNTTVDEPVPADRFTADRNRINRMLNYV